MKATIKSIFAAGLLLGMGGLTSCVGDLDVTPIDPNLNTADKITAEQSFNKCYAVIAMAGNGGANGDCDVLDLDGGTTGYIRQMFNSNELTTDEAICSWGDEGISTFCDNTFDASHPMLKGYYNRLYASVAFCNQYLNDFGGYNATMTAEVRFLRAFSYYLLMDAFGNVPFALEVSSNLPSQISRADLFVFVEKELLEVEPLMSEAKAKKSTDAGYGRVDKAAAWQLLARLYLNAEVYTGVAKWSEAAKYAKKVMESSYKLNETSVGGWSAYQMLFMGDNGETDAAYEAVFPILQDGLTTTSWGSSLFLIAGCFDKNMHANPNDPEAINGTTEQWGGNRCRPDLLKKFFPAGNAPQVPSYIMALEAGDDRALFDGVDRTLGNIENNEVGAFTFGYAVAKFTNFKTDGTTGHSSQFPDADYFLFRSAECYLIYAEATAREKGSDLVEGDDALDAFNALRTRAHADTKSRVTLSDICDEWSREFYFEGIRRPTLIRFNRFGGDNNYNWEWKGGTVAGRNFPATKNLFAIPTSDLIANSNLKQNPGY